MARKPGAGGVIVLALIFGVITAVLLGNYLRKQAEKNKENWKPVVVAAQEIKGRTKITREMVRIEHFPKELIAENIFEKPEEVVGRTVKDTIKSKEQIRSTDVLSEGEAMTLAIKVRDGMRAIAIGASEIIAVGTSIQPGDRVDIIATYQDPRTRQDLTKMILQNVPVLAVNRGKTDADGKEGANSSMTLEVTPEQTELITAAERSGTLRVSLRSVHDENVVPSPGIGARDLSGGGPVAVEASPAAEKTPVVIFAPSTGPRTRAEITIIKGSEEKTITP